ncbi:MAG TPA: hypothetical protein VD815_02680 [Candidatus Saccharimonadales bacterium]|nr:hypothetical protein [Candidatus Saccharimonadales bacterium]
MVKKEPDPALDKFIEHITTRNLIPMVPLKWAKANLESIRNPQECKIVFKE